MLPNSWYPTLENDIDGDILDDMDDDDDVAQNEFFDKFLDREAVIPEDKQQVELELCTCAVGTSALCNVYLFLLLYLHLCTVNLLHP